MEQRSCGASIIVIMPNLYIISGCNGAGKTTASYTVLPELLNCYEFVNADNIAAELSPFNPENVAVEAGRIMLKRIKDLLKTGVDFAFETTLATRSYVSFIKLAKEKGYKVTLLYFWLSSPQMAMERVATRVSEGGHHIPDDVVERRYHRGIKNLIDLYINISDSWIVMDNTNPHAELIANGSAELEKFINNNDIWETLLVQSDDNKY
jgi:predicted ABC-type ATPase